MLPPDTIRRAQPEDFYRILDIHKEIFAVFEFDYAALESEYRKLFSPEHTIVACSDQEIVGFGCFNFFDDDYQIYPEQRQDLDRYIQQEQTSEISVLKRYTNDFSESGYRVRDDDVAFTSLATSARCRRRGIGRGLTRAMLDIAEEHGSTAAFVSCWGECSAPLYTSLGFEPVACIGQKYSDGTSAVIMGNKIDKRP
jgi:ribosomal protein S18 acetylase RimI-like enzyme